MPTELRCVSLIPITRLLLVIVIVHILLIIFITLATTFPSTPFPCLALAIPFVTGAFRDVYPPVTALSRMAGRALIENKH
jgi:hypothetical protein